jgi:hypothetical protein
MLLTEQKTEKAKDKTATTQQTQANPKLEATWVIENNQLVCKWLRA